MKERMNTIVATAFLVMVGGYANLASAHALTETLASGDQNFDFYEVSCFSWPNAAFGVMPGGQVVGPADGVDVRILGGVVVNADAALPHLRATTVRTGGNFPAPLHAIDNVGALPYNDANYSAPASYRSTGVDNGNGTYNIIVTRNADGANAIHTYTLDVHCRNTAAGHTGTGSLTGPAGAAEDFDLLVDL